MPSRINPETQKEEQTIYVRVVYPMMVFQKDSLIYPQRSDYDTETAWEFHKDDPPLRQVINVHGYDELGRKVCPVFEVPDCEDIQNAIHNEKVRDARDRAKILYNGRLIVVSERDYDKYPKWIGHPTVTDKPEEIHRKILAIRENQILGDTILELEDPSEPYWLPVAGTEDVDKASRDLRLKYLRWLTQNPDKAKEVNFNPQAAPKEPVAA